jgi:FkbM family methyltransferase
MFKLNLAPFNDVILLQNTLHSDDSLLMEVQNSESMSFSYRFSLALESSGEKVYSISINKIIEEFSINRIDVLKVDIEGGEMDLFLRNLEWLDICGQIIIELHDNYVDGCSEVFLRAISKYSWKMSFSGENFIFSKSAN